MRLRRKRKYQDIDPDERLIDAENLPGYDQRRLEGRIAPPIEPRAYRSFVIAVSVIGLVFMGQLLKIQIVDSALLSARAEANRLEERLVIAERGIVIDRAGVALAENEPAPELGFSIRRYPLGEAAAHLVGYVSYPARDANGYWSKDASTGVSGIEAALDAARAGVNGAEIREVTAQGDIVSGSIVRPPENGDIIALSIDAGIQGALYAGIKERAIAGPFVGGAGAIMDIRTGEILALASYPSFDPEAVALGDDRDAIATYLADTHAPFLDRAIAGLYTPGSVVKPFIAAAALSEGVINPEKKILSTGSISVPNPYDPSHPTVFRDWKAHGWVDMRHAIAVSSDVYFYEVGGGFEDQRGLGISAIEEYLRRFGIGEATGIGLAGEEAGVIPNPAWKLAEFGERWLLGNTYHTAIGQYGFQVTPIELTRAVAAIANGGALITPTLIAGQQGAETSIQIPDPNLQVVREGMRLGVIEGTASALAVPGVAVGGKTGTAEVGARKEFTNSLVIGFFPYDAPRYAFAVVMERSKAGTPVGAPAVMQQVLSWIVANRPEMVH